MPTWNQVPPLEGNRDALFATVLTPEDDFPVLQAAICCLSPHFPHPQLQCKPHEARI